MNIIILGAAQHAKVVTSLLKTFHNTFKIIGYLDDDKKLHGKKLLDYPVLGPCRSLSYFVKTHPKKIDGAIVGISNRYMLARKKLFKLILDCGLKCPTLIHPKAYISPHAKVGDGCIINPGVILNAFANVGNNCVIYSNSVIEHECKVGDNVYIGPGVNLAANIQVGENTFIGMGSNIIPHIKIGSHVTIGAGSVVIKDIPNKYTVAGIPAKFLHRRKPKL